MLKITLRNDEKLVINGAVIRAVGRTELFIENDVSLLRGREVMAPGEANTPARRLYFACMLAYLDPANRETHRESILTLLADLMNALESPAAKALCVGFAHHVGLSDYYRALAECRGLIDYETGVLSSLAA
ncbi:flagellar biosynthesis repressor FlbT [soil metagenome]